MSDTYETVLSSAEALTLARRRAGESQDEAAGRLGVPVGIYRHAETGVGGARVRMSVTEAGLDRLGGCYDLTPGERCWLYRRRSGKQLVEVAAAVKMSTAWVSNCETGRVKDCTLLLDWWTAQQAQAAEAEDLLS